MEVNIHYAKTNLSQLLLKAESGEEVVIARAGKPVVRLVPLEAPRHRPTKPAELKRMLKESLKIAPDAFDPKVDEEIAASFYENPLPMDAEDMARIMKKLKKARKK
jgi:prevent-host-death family protein